MSVARSMVYLFITVEKLDSHPKMQRKQDAFLFKELWLRQICLVKRKLLKRKNKADLFIAFFGIT